ncbi:hypothetical protein HDV05_007718 [Chytridiales sp. JEL 0842]|nr:hypothetical protein HDV05_007718 [Chytridiales sp. JEL 0842]
MLRRSFHSAPRLLAAVEASAATAIDDKKGALSEANQWLKTQGTRFVKSPPYGSNYVGRDNRPFPMNPYFQPTPPLSDSVKDEIYQLYMEKPAEMTPLNLAKKFGISIIRVQAILRLKALEKKYEETNKPLQVHLNREMERLLSVGVGVPFTEPLRALPLERMKPIFQLVGDEEFVTPEDAATLLGKEPYANVQLRLDKTAEKVFTLEAPKDNEKPPAIAFDPNNTSKFQFSFVNTTKVEKPELFIRTQKGDFRKATRAEVFAKKARPFKFFM